MLGKSSDEGRFVKQWTHAGAALTYLAIWQAPGLDATSKNRVASWLSEVAGPIELDYNGPVALVSVVTYLRNNHAYWAGLTVASAGIAANNREQLNWGFSRARFGLDQITPEEALPIELSRKAMALHYRLFALEPLAALVQCGAVNKISYSEMQMIALDRLASSTFEQCMDSGRLRL